MKKREYVDADEEDDDEKNLLENKLDEDRKVLSV